MELTLRPRDSDGFGLVVDPWPFCTARVSVRAEGKRLRGLFSTQEELIRTLDAAEPVLVTADLNAA